MDNIRDIGKRALITGAAGFIGSNLARKLSADGWGIHAIALKGSDTSNISNLKGAIVYEHDGSTHHMVDIVKKARPQIVFHLASLFLATHEQKDVEPLIRSNILFGCQLLEAMVTNKCNKIINTGTSWQHFNNENYNPVCLYAATKQSFEDILRFYVEAYPLKAVTLKLFDTYGPNDPRKKLFALLKRGTAGETLSMSPGKQLIDLVYVDDVVDAFIRAGEILDKIKERTSESYAVSSSRLLELKEIVSIYEGISGKKLDIKWGKQPYRAREVMKPWNKGKGLPGWKPKISLEEGIRKLIAGK